MGYAATQIALRYGARVVATDGTTHADALRGLGAEVTGYGGGMAERVRELAGGPADLDFDAAPVSNSLPKIVRTVAKPEDALTMSDFAAAQELGVRFQSGEEGHEYHHHVLGE
ncbi:zinc-binding dehydrogenase [Streptomyces boncukensis]|uniref:zinc-binding dehydrogenase n=1 Tax=Streptomyces boncukensis TaxID=2711219 RepID=UPI0019D0763C|nr:zinc-binding dehydrogenase [Streptomyces boncukensis]